MSSYLIKGGNVITPEKILEQADVLVENGKITENPLCMWRGITTCCRENDR